MIKTALVLKGERNIDLFRLLNQCSEISIVGLACPDGRFDWLAEEERKNVFVTADLEKIIALSELETVIDGTGEPEVIKYLKKNLVNGVKLEELAPRSILNALINSREQLLETRLIKNELFSVLNAVQDAVEVVDAHGIVKYVNPAFTRVTGIPEEDRVKSNIFEVSPHGALAQSLMQQKPVTGYRTYVGGSDADVISNASPIILDGELMGAVVVFQPVGNILKLMDELKYSNTIIDSLYAEIDQLSGSRLSFESLTGQSKVFTSAVESARKASRSDSAVLISGESGTGKSLFARAIHNNSSRKKRPLIVIDCSSVPDSRQEIELFGCEKGAMPGILRTRLGKMELAQGSTLFIKEINSLNPYLQQHFLKLLVEQRFFRIGGEKAIPVDIRIIASASEDLINASLQGKFSIELYRHLSLAKVNLPPLRKRPEDIPLLAEGFMDNIGRKHGKKVKEISPRARQEMTEYDWPGNISELKNAIERSVALTEGAVIEHRHLAPYIGRLRTLEVPEFDEIVPIDKVEQRMVQLALTRYGETLEGKKKAAQALNISLATLYNKLKKY